MRTYQTGDTFGELCILHAAKRQATVKARTDGILNALKREVYSNLRKISIVKKRSSYIENLKKVNIFYNLNAEDFEKLSDVLTEVRYEAD